MKLDSNERYNNELQFSLAHRSETQMNIHKAKAYLRGEMDPTDDEVYN